MLGGVCYKCVHIFEPNQLLDPVAFLALDTWLASWAQRQGKRQTLRVYNMKQLCYTTVIRSSFAEQANCSVDNTNNCSTHDEYAL